MEAAAKKNKNKNIEKRLQALLLRGQGMKRTEVAERTGFSVAHITKLTSRHQKDGIDAIVENHYPGNHQNLSFEEEAALLQTFMKAAESGAALWGKRRHDLNVSRLDGHPLRRTGLHL